MKFDAVTIGMIVVTIPCGVWFVRTTIRSEREMKQLEREENA